MNHCVVIRSHVYPVPDCKKLSFFPCFSTFFPIMKLKNRLQREKCIPTLVLPKSAFRWRNTLFGRPKSISRWNRASEMQNKTFFTKWLDFRKIYFPFDGQKINIFALKYLLSNALCESNLLSQPSIITSLHKWKNSSSIRGPERFLRRIPSQTYGHLKMTKIQVKAPSSDKCDFITPFWSQFLFSRIIHEL